MPRSNSESSGKEEVFGELTQELPSLLALVVVEFDVPLNDLREHLLVANYLLKKLDEVVWVPAQTLLNRIEVGARPRARGETPAAGS